MADVAPPSAVLDKNISFFMDSPRIAFFIKHSKTSQIRISVALADTYNEKFRWGRYFNMT